VFLKNAFEHLVVEFYELLYDWVLLVYCVELYVAYFSGLQNQGLFEQFWE